ncbi:GTP-binding protein, putative [Pediculus humanus corporis]|uniref:GTP-binding protein, putative n=1 Tax=Pediculus humanus subsp. corporis TaxID=121224 RepID=E0VSH9_PEDHC|nr:GTP-binding protein, putative [Pediculus humanus corporis]EEB16335.1 GTP-binding protein, putative [Pediculus humanus corporis]
MKSFLSLFDPNENSENVLSENDDFSHCQQLPPEPQVGNIEYKLKLINPSKLRFQHLVTQMKWRIREGHGEAIYEIGVEDDGALAGLQNCDMAASLQTLKQMAVKLGASCSVLRERTLDNGKKVAEVLVRKVPDDQHNIEVRVAVMGSADAGKSTLLGVLTQGQLDNGRGRARLNMFRHLHEVQSGRTSSISHEILGFDSKGGVVNYSELMTSEEICENSAKLITFMDLAGHKKYLKTTIAGLTGYLPHYAMIVVSSSAGILGMTHEHLSLALALDVPFFVVVTKIDVSSPQQTLTNLENLLKSAGCHKVPLLISNEDDVITASSNQKSENVVPMFSVSNVTGEGLDLLSKFLHLLPPGISIKEKERLEQELCEFQVDETFRIPEVGTVVGGLLIRGVVVEGTKLLIGPFDDGYFKPVKVQSIHRNKTPCRMVRASQSASLSFTPEIPGLRNGMILVSPELKPAGSIFFQATVIVLFHATAIHRGFQTTVHIGNIRQTAIIEGIMAVGGIHTNERASVLFRFVRHPEYVRVGMRLLFREGKTKGIGTVTQVFAYKPHGG